jgi:hypothetical protein
MSSTRRPGPPGLHDVARPAGASHQTVSRVLDDPPHVVRARPHRTVLTTAVTVEELHDLAELAPTELLVIDADTTPRRFAQELRWNAAALSGR